MSQKRDIGVVLQFNESCAPSSLGLVPGINRSIAVFWRDSVRSDLASWSNDAYEFTRML